VLFRSDYRCVRGPISARILGLDADRALTDGAILSPMAAAFPRAATGTGGTAIVPHWETLEHPGWPEVARLTGFELIDPRGTPEAVIARIAAARLVLTESLHGAILADTYGIPWIAFACSKNFSITKWADWTASVGLDFTPTMVPPPDAGPVLAFGRTPAPLGQTLRFDAETAIRLFDQRMAPAPATLKARLKGAVKHSPLIRPFLGFSPARTAEALQRLAGAAPALSAAPRREELQARMLERLAAVAALPRRAAAA